MLSLYQAHPTVKQIGAQCNTAFDYDYLSGYYIQTVSICLVVSAPALFVAALAFTFTALTGVLGGLLSRLLRLAVIALVVLWDREDSALHVELIELAALSGNGCWLMGKKVRLPALFYSILTPSAEIRNQAPKIAVLVFVFFACECPGLGMPILPSLSRLFSI